MAGRYSRFVCHWPAKSIFANLLVMTKISSENLEGAADRGGQISIDDTVQLVIVIGQSGSGHSTALNILEDASFTG